jgi:DNA-binding NarL/FixJ family response regulator
MRPKSEEPGQRVRVILVGELETEAFGEDSPFEIQKCDDVRQITRHWEATGATVLLVDLERLSDFERSRLRKQMAQFTTILVVAIADSIDDKACENLLRTGCVGSVRHRETRATLLRALKAVLAGELWFPRSTLSRVLRGFLAAQDPNRLTSREVEILGLVGEDLNNQQIADKLFISRETVRWHIKGLNSKLGIGTRRGLRDHIRLLRQLGNAMPAHRESGNHRHSRAAS